MIRPSLLEHGDSMTMRTETLPRPAMRSWYAIPPAQSALDAHATMMRFHNGESICHTAQAEEFCYRLVSGAARRWAVTSSGSRHIMDFLFPDDFFGIDESSRWSFEVEVMVDHTSIARYSRRLVERLADSDPLVARRIREAALKSITRLESRMLILSLGLARQRVCAFLLEIADRLGDSRCQEEIGLPMPRCDIADYLGIAVETVSRVLTQLRLEGLIRFTGLRRLRVCDRGALERICEPDACCRARSCV